jgi:hypothetical protein
VPSGQYSVAAVIGGNVWKQNWSAPALQQKEKAALGGLFVIIFSVVSLPRSFFED